MLSEIALFRRNRNGKRLHLESFERDVLIHGTAHYSKNWTKEDQKEYNHWYYLNKIKKKFDSVSNPITGNADQRDMAEAQSTMDEWSISDWIGSDYATQQKMTDDYDRAFDDYNKAKTHYKNRTLEGIVKDLPNKISDAKDHVIWTIEDGVRDTKEKITGQNAKRDAAEAKMLADRYSEWAENDRTKKMKKRDTDNANKYYEEYNKAISSYNKSLFGRGSRALKALLGEDYD